MNALLQDLRYAVRSLAKSPGFTAVAVLTLALGIGAITAMFSAVNAVLLRPLPYLEADRIQIVWATSPRFAAMGYPEVPAYYNDITEWRKQSQSLESVTACRPSDRTITDGDTPERLGGAIVTHEFFALFGVAPILGRTFTQEEDSPGRNQVVVISHGLWQRRFAGDPAIIGRTIALDGVRHTVVGVMPPRFQFPRGAELPAYFGFAKKTDFWVPFGVGAPGWTERTNRAVVTLARLKRGIAPSAAQVELDTIAARIEKQFPDSNAEMGVKLLSLRKQIVASSRTPLLMLLGAVGFVLLIVCANIASLLLARATTRQKEIAIRSALGANRVRVVRQMMTESLLLAGVGALCGVGVARLALMALLTFGPANLPQLQETRLDSVALAFTAVITLLVAVLFGLAPALQAAKTNLHQVFKDCSGQSTGGSQHRLREMFVVSQIALALTLLVGSGLLIRSLAAVLAVDVGFRADSVLTFEVPMPADRYNKGGRAKFFDQFRNRLESLPGVRAVGAISLLPLGGGSENYSEFTVDGAPPSRDKEMIMGERRDVAGSYFTALGIPLIKGRIFTDQEAAQVVRRVVINETLARRFFSAQDPIGKRLVVFGFEDGDPPQEIVGVVRDVKSVSLETPTPPQIYTPRVPNWDDGMSLVVRTSGDPRSLVGSVRTELRAIDSSLPLVKIRTMDQVVGDTVTGRRFNLLLLGLFAALALLLTTIGIYGSMAYSVNHRAREIGIRMALGAQRGSVLLQVMRQGLKLTILGTALGLAGSLALSRFMTSLLFEISAVDPGTLAMVPLLLFAVAMLACYVPARRATKVDPKVALRCE